MHRGLATELIIIISVPDQIAGKTELADPALGAEAGLAEIAAGEREQIWVKAVAARKKFATFFSVP